MKQYKIRHNAMYSVLYYGYHTTKEITKENLQAAVKRSWITVDEMDLILRGDEE